MGGFGDSLGPLLIGPLITTFLYGISSLQTYIYFTRHASDRREMKLWVTFIWLVDTTQVILVCYGIYFWVHGHTLRDVDADNNPLSDRGKRTMEASSGMNLLNALVVQCFFVKRIFQLSRDRYKWWLLSGMAALVITHFALGSDAIVQVIRALDVDSTVEPASLIISAVMPYTIAAVLSDLCVAVALILLLRVRRADVENMNSVVDRAVNFLLTRCLLVTAAAVVRLSTFAAMPNATWYIAVDFTIGKIYSNSLLAMLNSRQPTSRASQDTPLESGQFFTTVVDVPSFGHGSGSTTTTGQTTSIAQRIGELRSIPVPVAPVDGGGTSSQIHEDKNERDILSHYIPAFTNE
ncbi:hypothetical protein BXZ70DRAFT_449791 [Cristinia sonorae]|uniref:DUF6534 domain-containing protein n=1 Tax=Cristinia sonorae TaxID=1940300 RepID=A0A8K0UJ96_9AGAR|nr:hypothetical protein BXZ70DRAFT_449791 [Cristinia sonorae]